MPRRYEISAIEMMGILEHGKRQGYLKFKDLSAGEGLRYLILEIESVFLSREHEQLQIALSEREMERYGKQIRRQG